MENKEYKGQYRVGRRPDMRRLTRHNAKSWEKLERVIERKGGVSDFDSLSVAVKDHESGEQGKPHPYQFVIYCIRNGWLERV